tara:strand:+ start:229 stop:747 length:519 start_codon:yes stop_codon:yes gene_type:complete
MPAKGYSTIGMKPVVIAKLQEVTDKNYLGMFLPSTIIIMMNEIKAERYQVHSHKLRLDLTGRYNSITVRSDVREWLHANYALLSEEYHDKYRINCFTKFVSYFLVNMIESKNDTQDNILNLKETDFKFLHKEYQKQKKALKNEMKFNFEQFVDNYISELFNKMEMAKKALAI